MPNEIIVSILSYLNFKEVPNKGLVTKKWYNGVKNAISLFGESYYNPKSKTSSYSYIPSIALNSLPYFLMDRFKNIDLNSDSNSQDDLALKEYLNAEVLADYSTSQEKHYSIPELFQSLTQLPQYISKISYWKNGQLIVPFNPKIFIKIKNLEELQTYLDHWPKNLNYNPNIFIKIFDHEIHDEFGEILMDEVITKIMQHKVNKSDQQQENEKRYIEIKTTFSDIKLFTSYEILYSFIQHLHTFNIGFNLSDATIDIISEFLTLPNNVKKLIIKENDLDDNTLKALLKNFKHENCNIEELDFSGSKLSLEDDFDQIIYDDIDYDGWDDIYDSHKIFDILSDQKCTLRKLNLSNTDLGIAFINNLILLVSNPKCKIEYINLTDLKDALNNHFDFYKHIKRLARNIFENKLDITMVLDEKYQIIYDAEMKKLKYGVIDFENEISEFFRTNERSSKQVDSLFEASHERKFQESLIMESGRSFNL